LTLSGFAKRLAGFEDSTSRISRSRLPTACICLCSRTSRGPSCSISCRGEHEGATRIDGFPTTDASRHKAYVNCFDLFDPRQIRVFAVASQPILDLRRIRRGVGANHIMFADPELQLGRALDLPLSGGDESNRYPRLAIVASNGNILAVLPDGNARQVMAWIVAHQ
jgi:hypothetical protein